MGSDERAIREVHSTWIDSVNAGDPRLLVMTTDDVVFLNPGEECIGRDGFSQVLRRSPAASDLLR